jgi:hypothetical protein
MWTQDYEQIVDKEAVSRNGALTSRTATLHNDRRHGRKREPQPLPESPMTPSRVET